MNPYICISSGTELHIFASITQRLAEKIIRRISICKTSLLTALNFDLLIVFHEVNWIIWIDSLMIMVINKSAGN